jgi:DNA-binding transcriptional ArsR family regulator
MSESEFFLVDKYLGPTKITEAKMSERKTYLGDVIIEVTLEHGIIKEIPLAMLRRMTTEGKSDLTKLRDAMVDPIIEKIIVVLLEAEIPFDDIDYTFTKAASTLNHHLTLATTKLWGKELQDRTLVDINNILNAKTDEGRQKPSGQTDPDPEPKRNESASETQG